jgi:hypothetical protein
MDRDSTHQGRERVREQEALEKGGHTLEKEELLLQRRSPDTKEEGMAIEMVNRPPPAISAQKRVATSSELKRRAATKDHVGNDKAGEAQFVQMGRRGPWPLTRLVPMQQGTKTTQQVCQRVTVSTLRALSSVQSHRRQRRCPVTFPQTLITQTRRIRDSWGRGIRQNCTAPTFEHDISKQLWHQR